MLPREVVGRIRRLQIRARRAVQDLLGGEYHSVFKGVGIAFEEVREYQPGDDVRSIDWNVTARMGHAYIKRFVEERELTVVLMVDASGSHRFGTQLQEKQEIVAELAALLSFAAVSNNDKVGLITFTEQVECFLPPRKGTRHALRLIREVLFRRPERRGTSIQSALAYLARVLHRRAIVFLLSDFLDTGYERLLKQMARRHDLVAIHVHDPRESVLPAVGLVRWRDAETGAELLLDTNSAAVRDAYTRRAEERRLHRRRIMHSSRVDLVEASTDGTHLDSLIRFFRMREIRSRRRG